MRLRGCSQGRCGTYDRRALEADQPRVSPSASLYCGAAMREADARTPARVPPRTSLTTRTTCRVCDSPELAPVLSLGDHAIAGAFADPSGAQPVQRTIPLELVRCDMTRDQNASGLIQTRHT